MIFNPKCSVFVSDIKKTLDIFLWAPEKRPCARWITWPLPCPLIWKSWAIYFLAISILPTPPRSLRHSINICWTKTHIPHPLTSCPKHRKHSARLLNWVLWESTARQHRMFNCQGKFYFHFALTSGQGSGKPAQRQSLHRSHCSDRCQVLFLFLYPSLDVLQGYLKSVSFL